MMQNGPVPLCVPALLQQRLQRPAGGAQKAPPVLSAVRLRQKGKGDRAARAVQKPRVVPDAGKLARLVRRLLLRRMPSFPL